MHARHAVAIKACHTLRATRAVVSQYPRVALMSDHLADLSREITACHKCRRLVTCRERAGAAPPKRFLDDDYWLKPVPGFGDVAAKLLVVGLAPAAHGANRTGRMFTGDRSGDWLYAALHRAGYANQPTSKHADDGLVLTGAYVTNMVRCAPPDNKPTPKERDRCLAFFHRELALLPAVRAIVALGGFAWDGVLRAFDDVPTPRPKFGHGASVRLGRYTMFGSYHVSQQNTFTGRLTEPMLDAVFASAQRCANHEA